MSLPPTADKPFRVSVGTKGFDGLATGGKPDVSATRTLKCRTVAKSRFRQLNYIRDLPPQPAMEDEPYTGLDEIAAPSAPEALLAAFGSCFAVGIHANAVARGVPIRSLELELQADVDATGGWGAGDLKPRAIGFETIRILVRMEADAPRQSLDALIHHALLWSPVGNTLHNPVHLDVTLAPD